MINKKVMVFFILSIFLVSSISIVYAKVPTPGEALSKAFDGITKLFGVEWKDQAKFIGFMRFLLWVLMFTLFYTGGRFIFKEQKNVAIIVAAILGLISTLFIPKEIILGIISTYSTIVASLLIGIPIIAALYITIYIIPNDNRFWYFLKAIICIIVYFVLTIIVDAVENLGVMGIGAF